MAVVFVAEGGTRQQNFCTWARPFYFSFLLFFLFLGLEEIFGKNALQTRSYRLIEKCIFLRFFKFFSLFFVFHNQIAAISRTATVAEAIEEIAQSAGVSASGMGLCAHPARAYPPEFRQSSKVQIELRFIFCSFFLILGVCSFLFWIPKWV